jgi:capsule biosynthesis phosphatase
MTYVFDLDNTICNTIDGDYENSTPYQERIKLINLLHKEGNRVVIYTARGMGSTDNNQLEAIQRYYSLTEKQLEKWGLVYDILILGKPAGDFYIDDKGVESEHFFRTNICP